MYLKPKTGFKTFHLWPPWTAYPRLRTHALRGGNVAFSQFYKHFLSNWRAYCRLIHISSALFFNWFVNEIFGNLLYETFGRRGCFFWFLTKNKSKNVYFLLQNNHLKPKIDCKTNGKWELQTCFFRNYDFAFTNLFKNAAELWTV